MNRSPIPALHVPHRRAVSGTGHPTARARDSLRTVEFPGTVGITDGLAFRAVHAVPIINAIAASHRFADAIAEFIRVHVGFSERHTERDALANAESLSHDVTLPDAFKDRIGISHAVLERVSVRQPVPIPVVVSIPGCIPHDDALAKLERRHNCGGV